MTRNPDTVEHRVLRGAALLDEKRPGWHNEIDLDRLRMRRECSCIFGQLYGGYFDGRKAMGLPTGVDHGFDATPRNPEMNSEYKALKATWVALIRARRGEGNE